MFAARTQRVRPHLDDKILASWNGLMLGALARASAVLGDEGYRARRREEPGFPPGQTLGRQPPARFITAGATASATPSNCSTPTPSCSRACSISTRPRSNRSTSNSPSRWPKRCSQRFYDPEHGGFWQSAAGRDRSDPARQGGLRRRRALRQFRRHARAAEAGRHHRPHGFHAAGRRRRCGCSPTACSKRRRPCRTCCTRWISRWTNRAAS